MILDLFRLQHFIDKCPYLSDRILCFWEDFANKLPDMLHLLPDFQGDCHTGGFSPFRKINGIIQKNLVRTNLNQEGWETTRVCVQWGCQRGDGISLSKV